MRPLRPWLLAAAGYTALTLTFTWPLPTHLSSVLPHDIGDPLLNTWILWWNAHTVPLTARWWNAPFFWPLAGALGLSEHLLGVSLMATPIQWAGAEPVTAYNIVFLLSFPLSALAMHALAFTLTRRHDAAALAGVIFGFSPYRTAQIAHLQMLWTFWMPLALLALHRYAQAGRRRWLVLFGAMWLGQAASNGYYLMFFPVLVATWIAWFLLSRRTLARAGAVVGAWALASLPLLPIALAYQRTHERLALGRPLDEIRHFSADLVAFATTSPALWMWSALAEVHRAEQELFPGVTALALIAAAAVISWRRSTHLAAPFSRVQTVFVFLACALALLALTPLFLGPWQLKAAGVTVVSVATPSKPLTIAIWCGIAAVALGAHARRALATRSLFAFYVGAAGLMYVCSLGPEPAFQGSVFWYKPPYAWLMELPGFSTIRVPARFAMLATLCLAAAAALAFARLTSRMPRSSAVAAGAAIGCLALADCWVADLQLPAVPNRNASLEATPDAGAVVELPLGDIATDLGAMYRSMYHRRAVANGYSGFVPAPYVVLRVALDEGDAGALDALAAAGPLTVVVDPRTADRDWNRFEALVGRVPASEGTEWRIFPLPQATVREPSPSGARLPIRSAKGSTLGVDLVPLTDGDPISGWDSGSPQRGDEWLVLDLGARRQVSGVMAAIGPAFGNYARLLSIDASTDGQRWNTAFEGRSAGKAVAAAQRDPRAVPVTYAFPPVDAQWIRLRQRGYAGEFHWSISELAVFGR